MACPTHAGAFCIPQIRPVRAGRPLASGGPRPSRTPKCLGPLSGVHSNEFGRGFRAKVVRRSAADLESACTILDRVAGFDGIGARLASDAAKAAAAISH